MMNVTLDSLVKFFKKQNYDAQIQQETNQIYIILKIEEREFPLFVRIFDKSDLLQLLVFMPTQIKQGTHADLARLLHLINKELDIPGFGMDENAQVTYYRCMLPTPHRKIDPEMLGAYLKSIELICESVSPSVLAVASGLATYADILQAAKSNPSKPR